MTRANLNYIYQDPDKGYRVLYWYHNGDQYPTGLRDCYHVADFIQSDMTPEDFKRWIATNYSEETDAHGPDMIISADKAETSQPTGKQATPEEITHPCIYWDTANFIADYSYVFESTYKKNIKVFCWDKVIFDGDPKKFLSWLKRQK